MTRGALGPYQVLEQLGKGGMGEVYRARDTRLGRDVAIKVLPESFAFDAARRARFEREARALASLNHPNIATLYGIEDAPTGPVLVMELIEGDTLADRIALGGRLALGDVLSIARQIATGLEAAHERGIIHRDLKPSNIVVRPDGMVKILDFGLAKALDTAADALETREAAPTLTEPVRGMGPGTPAYMSPEQARGLPADKRTDIWAFGCVLYELLTGQRAFAGERVSDIIAQVLERDPDLGPLPAPTPTAIRRLLRRCLDKNPQKRLRDAGDACLEIEEALSGSTDSMQDLPPARVTRRPGWVVMGGVLALAALVGLFLYTREARPALEPVRFSVLPPDGGLFMTPVITGSGAPVGGAVSPDGRMVAFTARDPSGKVLLWVRRLDALEATPLAGTEDAALPFWSPDSRSLGFFGRGQLKRVNIADGDLQVLTEVVRGRGGSWNRDGVIIFASALGSGLSRVSAGGGEPQTLTRLATGQRSHRFPYFLPDGRHFLLYVEGPQTKDSGIFVGHLDGRAIQRLLAADSAAAYGAPDRVLFVRQGTLFAQPFDLGRLQVTGEPASLARGIPSEGTSPAFSVSSTGVLTYRSVATEDQQFGWYDHNGQLLEIVGPPGKYRGVDVSPDGQRIAVHRHEGDGGDIWVFEPRGTTTRVTFDPTQDNSGPVWSPDGSRIAFGSLRNGRWGLYQKPANSTEGDELLLESELPKIPSAWSPDGKSVLYWLYATGATGTDIWLFPMARDLKAGPLISTRYYEGHAQVSPNGKWIAYASTESGSLQVHVRAFPKGDHVSAVSIDGGVTPRWRADGKELFYVTSYDNGKLMAVTVRSEGDTFAAETPRELFDVGIVTSPHSTTIPAFHMYAVAPDGRRFLIPRPVSTLRSEGASTPITVVLNWQATLERRSTP